MTSLAPPVSVLISLVPNTSSSLSGLAGAPGKFVFGFSCRFEGTIINSLVISIRLLCWSDLWAL